MKKIITNEQLKEKMDTAIDLLCSTVKTTLGPKGSNVIIDHSLFTPFITNDGATIASNIESEDEVINTILSIAKEASLNTNESVGDGTTTTLVLLESIYKNGTEQIEKGKNRIILKEELEKSLENITNQIKNKSKNPNKKDLENIATTSASSKEIGKIISTCFAKTKNKEAIKIYESENEETKIIYKKGYRVETDLASPYYLTDKEILEIKNPYIFLSNNFINTLEPLHEIINEIIKTKKELIIIAEDYSDEIINEIINLYLQNIAKIYLLKLPGYGSEKIKILEDLSIITNSKIYENEHITKLETIDSLTINKNETIFKINKNEKIKEKIKDLKINNTAFNTQRLQMLTGYSIDIYVGGLSKTEKREKKMKFDDALCAISSCYNGISTGSGLTLYQISEELEAKTEADKILKNALKSPFEQIMTNAGLNSKEIIKIIKENNYNKIYNILTEKYEDISDTVVVDSTDVIINSLKNAISLASMLLTTTSLVINEYNNNLVPTNEYN